jgi:YegS/Rv2252/BmrU family lipid kinase
MGIIAQDETATSRPGVRAARTADEDGLAKAARPRRASQGSVERGADHSATKPHRLILLFNPKAGGDDGLLAAATNAFDRSGTKTALIEIDSDGAYRRELRERGPDSDGVVVAGGDGTFNHLLTDLIALGKPVGLLPMGTANDLARTLRIPADGEQAAQLVLGGHVRTIDVGTANGIPFCNAAGIGVSVQVTRELSSSAKSVFGVLAYARAAWRVLKRARGFRVDVAGDDGIAFHGRALQVTIANGVHYGGGMTVHESAAIDDRSLDLIVVRPRKASQLIRHFLAFRRGRYAGAAPVWAGRTRKVEVATRRPRDCALDGEIRTRTPLVVEVKPAALRMFAPSQEES